MKSSRRDCLFAAGAILSILSCTADTSADVPQAIPRDVVFAPWAKGLKEPTSMVWVTLPADGGKAAKNADHVLLVLEKWTGNVRCFVRNADGSARPLDTPAIKLAVNFKSERGLLGIAVHPHFERNQYVYLFYTKSDRDRSDGRSDVTGGQTIQRFHLAINRNASGDLESLRLEKPAEILTFPYEPLENNGPNSCGGKILFGSDGKLYGVYGDQNRTGIETNHAGGRTEAGIIFRLNDDGSIPRDNPWATHKDPWVRRYFAVGIRNCFGLAFDPETGVLWDTENGDFTWDELNRVPPKFNSGSTYIMGPLSDPDNAGKLRRDVPADLALGSVYGDPVFAWYRCRGLTCLAFLHTDRYGPVYKDTLLVGEVNGSWLMHFWLNRARDRVDVKSPALSSMVVRGDSLAQIAENQKEIMFATGAGTITDMQLGPDGLLYCCSYRDGAVYVMKPVK